MYIHTDVFAFQSPKKLNQPCGDAYGVLRDLNATTIVLADGLGSGVKAHIAANMCVARIKGLISEGASIREAFKSLTDTMDKAWGSGDPFSVFTVARILNTGQATILSYEMPPPILINPVYAQILQDRVYTQKKAIIHESSCVLSKDEGILLMSDGITQAGIGGKFLYGWESEGVQRYIESKLTGDRVNGEDLVADVHAKGRSYWPADKGDDCSVVMGMNRRGVIVNLVCGPPKSPEQDYEFAMSFLRSEGIHIVCGGTTAKIIAKAVHKKLEVKESTNPVTPPAYKIEGFEMVTEGVVTLNQVYHLMDDALTDLPMETVVGELAWYLRMADRINIWEGTASNLGHGQIEFKLQGIFNRSQILKELAQKLRDQGKLVVHTEWTG
ncbi:MAG: SpoIIE family protein phosphatase [Bacteroidales bacterium]|jgi:hypothetical protein|nr:SpoIIE family protein phosphatase [Bacteroidales bacterium]